MFRCSLAGGSNSGALRGAAWRQVGWRGLCGGRGGRWALERVCGLWCIHVGMSPAFSEPAEEAANTGALPGGVLYCLAGTEHFFTCDGVEDA